MFVAVNSEDSSEAGVDKVWILSVMVTIVLKNLLHKLNWLHCGVEDPDLGVSGQI